MKKNSINLFVLFMAFILSFMFYPNSAKADMFDDIQTASSYLASGNLKNAEIIANKMIKIKKFA